MKRIWTVALRELKGYFDHATAYILVVAFLGLAFFLSFRTLYAVGFADLRSFFDLLPWLFAVFIPAVTMRSLAEERSRGTLEWLVTQPLSEWEMVVGKFLGSWVFALVVLAGTLPMAIGVLWIGSAPLGPALAQYIGAALLAAQLSAIGLFASGLTRNQITAFITGALICVAMVLAGMPFTLVTLPSVLAGLVAQLAIVPHFDSVARGVLDLRDVLYFVSMAGLFVCLAWFLVLRERLSSARGAYRRLRTGVVGLAAAVLLLNLVGQRIHGRIDLTADGLYTLSDGTRDVLSGLDDLVTIKLFVSESLPPEIQTTLRDVRDLLTDYRRSSNGNLRVEELHPDEDEEAASEAGSLGIREMQFNVVRQDEFEIRAGWLGLSIQYAAEQKTLPFIARTDDLEYQLTSSIARMTGEGAPRVTFLTSFGAKGPMALPELNQVLSERYQVGSLQLQPDSMGSMPPLTRDSTDVLAVVGPNAPVSEEVAIAIDSYLDTGGAALFLLENSQLMPQEPFTQPLDAGLGTVLEERGIRFGNEMAYDLQSNQTVSLGRQSIFNLVAPYPLWPMAVSTRDHAANRDLEVLSLAWAGALEITDSVMASPLWTTTEYGGRKPAMGPIDPQTTVSAEDVDPADLGVQVLAAASLPPADAGTDDGGASGGRIIVVGDADFVASQFAQQTPQNLSFAANAIDWLAQDESLIEIRSKDRTPPPLSFSSDFQQSALKWGNMLGIPLIFILLGWVRSARRRDQARALWDAVAAQRGGAS